MIKHRFGVVAERLESKIELIAEGQVLLRDEIKVFRAEVNESFGEFGSMIRRRSDED